MLAWFSFMFYHDAVYLLIVQLVYEAITVVSFYMLMCHWIAPDLASQQEYFRDQKPPKWNLISLCGVRSASSGVAWFNVSFPWIYLISTFLFRIAVPLTPL